MAPVSESRSMFKEKIWWSHSSRNTINSISVKNNGMQREPQTVILNCKFVTQLNEEYKTA